MTSVRFNDDLVVARPDIYQVALGSDAEFVVLASDGLWDYMTRSIDNPQNPFCYPSFSDSPEIYLHNLANIAAQMQFLL